MADTLRLAPNRYQSPESSLGRRQRRFLNPIIEEDSDDGQIQQAAMNLQRRRGEGSHLKIEAWLSPLSDHFPTPRGVNYLAAPVLPSSPSTVSADDSSPTNSSNRWNRVSVATDNTDFEDIYDVSDEEDDLPRGLKRSSSIRRKSHATDLRQPSPKQPARLIIPTRRPGESWSAIDELKKITSPVPLTPSAQLAMSPAQLDFMGMQQAMDLPGISAPPSLDGSLSSEQLAAMSSPPTPVIGNEDNAVEEAWAGVHLQPGALATLRALSTGEEDLHEQPSQLLDLEVSQIQQPPMEMQQQPLRLSTSFAPQPIARGVPFSPYTNRQSLADLTKLDIPSPGGFFSELTPRTRSTWHMTMKTPDEMPPPTSTTAEQFYRCPWNAPTSVPPMPQRPDSAEGFYRSFESSSSPVEQVIEVQDDDLSDDMPTARPILPHQDSNSSGETAKPASPVVEKTVIEIAPEPATEVIAEAATEIVVDHDMGYARKQQEEALSNLDRTELWLMAQRSYLKGVDVTQDGDAALQTIAEDLESEEDVQPKVEKQSEKDGKKKVVRFSNIITTTALPKSLPSKLLRQESAYYRAFQDYVVRTHLSDVFVHQLSRFEALQAQRVALRETHRNQLLGKYQLSVIPQSAKKRLSANVARGDLTIVDDPEKLRREKEFEAKTQMSIPTWHVAAMKFLNGGKLISAPVTKRLARLSCMPSSKNGVARDRARILDLGGQTTCDWAWHCALQYPNSKVYTVTTKAIRQLSNSNVRGPPNHRQVAVDRLTRLPFEDNHFDLVSARELHSILKFIGENGEDEWETCLKECMRVLKPGGYLEFSLLDSDIMNAGPLGRAKSVEFGFSLKTLGYDPNPSKLWLGRLARAGFQDVRRAWVCLPVGAKRNIHKLPVAPVIDGTTGQEVKTCQMDAMVMGSTDNIANVCSIVGGWSWERWLLRCEMEKSAGELRLVDTVTAGEAMREAGKCLEGVHAVMEEGRSCRAGYRMLNGYAKKPKVDTEVINIAFDF